MSSLLQDELGVALSGVKWDIGNFRLWQSTQPDVILFVARQPALAISADGRYQFALTAFRQRQQGTDQIISGSASFSITSVTPHDDQTFEQKEQWRTELIKRGYSGSLNPEFKPLPIREGAVQVLLDPQLGKASPVGTQSGTYSFLVELTALGAKQWVEGIENKTAISAEVQFTYEYPQISPSGSWNWVKADQIVELTTLFEELDRSYINQVYTPTPYPVSIIVRGNAMLQTVALSWSASEGTPELLVFDSAGGTAEYNLTSLNPDDVIIRYNGKVSFALAKWPVIETSGEATVAQGGNRIVLQPGQWVGRLTFHLIVREGNQIKPATELSKDDYLVVNISYQGSYLRIPVKDSARVTPREPIQFSYLKDPQGRPSQIQFSCFGLIGGHVVRAKEQLINFDDVFILASKDGIQLGSKRSVISTDNTLV